MTRDEVKTLAKKLKAENPEFKLSWIYESIAHSLGYKDWNTLSAELKYKEAKRQGVGTITPLVVIVPTDTDFVHNENKGDVKNGKKTKSLVAKTE